MEDGQNTRYLNQSILVFVLFRLSFVFVCFVQCTHFLSINHWFILPILFHTNTHFCVPFTFLSVSVSVCVKSTQQQQKKYIGKCFLHLIYSSSHNNRQDSVSKRNYLQMKLKWMAQNLANAKKVCLVLESKKSHGIFGILIEFFVIPGKYTRCK